MLKTTRDLVVIVCALVLLIFAVCYFIDTPATQASSITPGAISAADLIQTIQTTGQYRGKTAAVYNIMGRRAGFTSTSVLNDVVQFANGTAAIPILTGVEPLEVVSSSVNDTNTGPGTGANQVKVTYIDASNNLVQSAAISLDGTTAVAAGFTAIEPLWMNVSTVGTGTVAAGNIRLRVVSGSVECEQITAGGNMSLSGRFMIPTGYTGYVAYWSSHAINNDQDLRIRAQLDPTTRAFSAPYHFIDTDYVPNNTGSSTFPPFLKIPALAKVKVSTLSAATGATIRADATFAVIIIAN